VLSLAIDIGAGHYVGVCRQIRVVIADSARAMRDMLFDAIRREPNVAVVAEVSDGASIAAVCELERADCAVVPLEEGRAPIQLCQQILKKRQGMKVIAVAAAAEVTALCWWSDGEVRCAYMESSRENIVKALGCPVS
jgi:DNA-binding NarL/FixJ family response regulator